MSWYDPKIRKIDFVNKLVTPCMKTWSGKFSHLWSWYLIKQSRKKWISGLLAVQDRKEAKSWPFYLCWKLKLSPDWKDLIENKMSLINGTYVTFFCGDTLLVWHLELCRENFHFLQPFSCYEINLQNMQNWGTKILFFRLL